MLSVQRKQCLKKIQWNWVDPSDQPSDRYGGHSSDEPNHAISILECWKPRDTTDALPDRNYRFIDICRQKNENGQRMLDVEAKFEQWLNWQDRFPALVSSQHAGVPRGGMRIVFCERSNRRHGMTISETTFLKIEKAFQLHPATLPSFFATNGAYMQFVDAESESEVSSRRMQMVIKLPQKVELGNSTISLCHDLSTGWTNALICGKHILTEGYYDQFYGAQLPQLVDVILADPEAWGDPLFLPFALLQNYVDRLQLRSNNVNDILTEVETEIGVTFAGNAGYQHGRERWPQDVDPKTTTIAIHSIYTQAIFISCCCQWAKQFGTHLLTTIHKVQSAAPSSNNRLDVNEINQTIEYLLHMLDGVSARFLSFKERANLQANVLFNVINQQQSILSQRDMQLTSRIAKSSKQDSISMTTFTFLTALFLPGTFISAMFSMGMFNWQPSSNMNDNSISPSEHRGSYVTSSFWIYWVVTLCLTVATMTTWYLWSRRATRKWLKELAEDADRERGRTNSDPRPSVRPIDQLRQAWGQEGLGAFKDRRT